MVDKIKAILPEENVLFVYLMGSAGTERFHDESDIDLAVYWSQVPSDQDYYKYLNALEVAFERDVDLVSLNNIDPIFARQVLETGRLLWCKSPVELLKWKVYQLSIYPDFKRSRKIIEDNLLIRKKYV